MRVPLTTDELKDLERHIEEIDNALDILDPSNNLEAQEIESKMLLLEQYVFLLEQDEARPRLALLN